MKKLMIASAVSALFAVPGTVLAQAGAAKAPTLDKVLEASGISMNGYIDVAYSNTNKNIESGPAVRVFDQQNNSFGLHQMGLTVAKTPKEGAGGLVNITAGRDAQVINSAGVPVSQVDLTQGYAQYVAGATTVMAGKFTTMHGTEVVASTGNNNFSRSILFGAVPFTHTGVRATFAANDTTSLMLGVNNGWDRAKDDNRGKTLELGATLAPSKSLTMTVSSMFGKESNGAGQSTKQSLNGVVNLSVTDSASIGAEVLDVSQELDSGGKGKYSGFALYASSLFSAKWRGSVRGEYFNDKQGYKFNTVDPTTGALRAVKYSEATATITHFLTDAMEVRGEVRMDKANTAVFDTSKTAVTAAVQALYKF